MKLWEGWQNCITHLLQVLIEWFALIKWWHCNTERRGKKKALKLELEREERRIFGRRRHRQDSVECFSALYCEFRSSQEFKIQIRINAWYIYLCFNIFEPVCVQVQIASALVSYKRRKYVCCEPSVMAGEGTSLNDLPDEILLKVFTHFGPEDLCLKIAKVCKKWNMLAKDMILWKNLSYHCDWSSDISHIVQVRYTASLGFRTT